jgi:hypothetical protein
MSTAISFTCKHIVLEWTESWGEHIMLQVFTKIWSENKQKKIGFQIYTWAVNTKLRILP